MPRKAQRRNLMLGAAGMLLFIAAMVALAVAFSGSGTIQKSTAPAGSQNGPVVTTKTGVLDKSGRYEGAYLKLSPPADATGIHDQQGASGTEDLRFASGPLAADISTTAALPGETLRDTALTYGPLHPVALSTGPGYIVASQAAGTRHVILLGYHDGRFVYITVTGAGDARALALQLARSLTLAPRQSAQNFPAATSSK